MRRRILVTGAASGIGAATVERCRSHGDLVIGVDLQGSDIDADLATVDGRRHMIAEAERLSPQGLDGVVAGAGISNAERPADTLAINFFGAVATLEGLRPLLAKSDRPRAVAICSTALMLTTSPEVIESCLAGDEEEALRRTTLAPDHSYATSKRALSLWLRRKAAQPDWAGTGILLNGVGPGVVETPMTAPLWKMPDMVNLIKRSNPIAVDGYAGPGEVAELIDFLLGFQSHYLVGQIIFIDGGTDVLLRPDSV